MPITLNDIQKLKRISSANFRKHVCENCEGEYFSIRESKFCSPACKQQQYRERLLNGEVTEKVNEEIKTNMNTDDETLNKLKEQENIINQKLKSI